MNIKKAAIERVIAVLRRESNDIDYRLYQNKAQMKRLVDDQSTLKRERRVIRDAIRDLGGEG